MGIAGCDVRRDVGEDHHGVVDHNPTRFDEPAFSFLEVDARCHFRYLAASRRPEKLRMTCATHPSANSAPRWPPASGAVPAYFRTHSWMFQAMLLSVAADIGPLKSETITQSVVGKNIGIAGKSLLCSFAISTAAQMRSCAAMAVA